MKYYIKYYYDGYGVAEVEAKNEQGAEDMFFKDEYDKDKHWGENYVIDNIEKK